MRVSYSRLYRVVAILLALVLSPLPMLAQGSSSSQPAGQITALVPQATRNGSAAKNKDDVMWNDVLRTEGGGRARIQLRDGSILSLGSNSELKVVQHDPATQQTQLELNYGRVRSRVVQITKPGGKFQVKTPTAVAGVVGTDFITIQLANGHTQIIVFSGQVVLIGANGAILATIGAGQMADVGPDGKVTGPEQTPPGVQQEAIESTNPGNGEGGGGGGGESHLLRNILIVLGIAAVGAIIYYTTDAPGTRQPTTTTPGPTCTSCTGFLRPRR